MAEAYIVAAKRTAGGRKGGAPADWHPGDLGAQTLNAIIENSRVDPSAIEDVIVGCVSQAGEQSNQIGRTAVLASNLPPIVQRMAALRELLSSSREAADAARGGVVAAGGGAPSRALGEALLNNPGSRLAFCNDFGLQPSVEACDFDLSKTELKDVEPFRLLAGCLRGNRTAVYGWVFEVIIDPYRLTTFY